MKDKYDLIRSSNVVMDEHGDSYPDNATFMIEDIKFTVEPYIYKLTENDTQRFFDLCYEFYETYDSFYEDLILWLNDIDDISDTESNYGKEIKFYTKNDLDNFYQNNLV